MKKLKIIQVGIGHDHAIATYNSILKQSDIFDLVGLVLCDGEKEKFGKHVEKYSATPIITLEEALAIEDLDAVAVECEDFDLTRYATIFAERGVHMHMDKPGGINQADYEKMLSVMKKKNLVFQTGYMYRFNPVIDETLKAIKNDKFGKIYSVEAHMDCIHKKEKREWLGDYPGGMMYYLGCHLIDLIVQIQGIPTEIIPLNCSTGFDGVNAKDVGMAVFKYENGVSFAKTSAAETGGFMRRQLVVCGENGTREIKPIESYVKGTSDIETPYFDSGKNASWTEKANAQISAPFDRYDTMMRHFAEYVTGERGNPYTYEYEAQLHKIVLAACGETIDYKSEVKL